MKYKIIKSPFFTTKNNRDKEILQIYSNHFLVDRSERQKKSNKTVA